MDKLSLEQQKQQLERLCPCCGLDPQVKPLPLCCDILQLADQGTGYILFFSLQNLGALICLVLALVNIYKIIANLRGEACFKVDDPIFRGILVASNVCISDWITVHSVANYGKQDTLDKLLMVLFLVIMLLLLGLYVRKFRKLASIADVGNDVPSDWTVVVGYSSS